MEIEKKRKANDDGRRPNKTARPCDDREQWAEASQAGTLCKGEDISARPIPEAPFPSPFVSQDGPLTRAKSRARDVYKLNRNKSSSAVRRLYDSYKHADVDVLISAIHLNGSGESKEKEVQSSDDRDQVILLLYFDSSSSDFFNIRYPKYGDLLDAIDKENRSAGVIKIERGTRGIGLEDETFWFLHILRPDTDIRVNGALFHFAGSARIRPLPDFATLEYHDQAHFIFTGLAGLHSSPQQAKLIEPLHSGTEILPYDPVLLSNEKEEEERATEAAKRVEAATKRAEVAAKQVEPAGQIASRVVADQQSNLQAATPVTTEIRDQGEAAAKKVDEGAAAGLASFDTEWNRSTGQAKAAPVTEERSRVEEAKRQEEADKLVRCAAFSEARQSQEETAPKQAQKQADIERAAGEADAAVQAAKTAYEEASNILNILARHVAAPEDKERSGVLVEKRSEVQEDGPKDIESVEIRDKIGHPKQRQLGQRTSSQQTIAKRPESPTSSADPVHDTSTSYENPEQDVSTDEKSSTQPTTESCDAQTDVPKPAITPELDNRISRYSGQNKEAILRDTRETLAGIPGLGLLTPEATINRDDTDLNKDDADMKSLFEE